MASVRKYGYYIKGNKVAIVEKDTAFDNDANSRDYGPGSNRSQWKSPLADITHGLEIQYTYAPTYRFKDDIAKGLNDEYVPFIGYGSYLGYLTLFTYKEDEVLNFSTAPTFTEGDWIHLQGSNRWDGLHQVKYTSETSSHGDWGVLILDVPFHLASSFHDKAAAFAIDNTITFSGVNDDNAQLWKEGLREEGGLSHYFIIDADTTADNGFFTSVVNETNATLEIANKITIDEDTGKETTTAHTLTAVGSDLALGIFQAFHDPMVLRKVDIMEDESFDIDLPSYLNKALVYYMKAKLAEDTMNFEIKEYFMKEFRKMVEKHNNTRVAGVRMQAAGPHAIR